MSLAAGTRLGPYEVLGLAGSGGMGEVYRARDTRLGRDVAIKILPAAGDQERRSRFEREARAIAALNHPNILAVHDVGVHDGAPYFVMELLEGQTLAQHLGGRPLPVAEAFDIAVQISSGLAAAHAKGIAHRDLKPDNVFVTTAGHVKILDFGLVRRVPGLFGSSRTELPTSGAAPGTEEGAILGTVGYMSPEQARGEPADQRSDIFSVGCILYEMLSGGRAFARDSVVETLNAILKDHPRTLAGAGVSIPEGLADIVFRCLSKRPEARFDSGADLVAALRRLPPPAPPNGAQSERAGPSLVVLPFADLSPQRDSEYFSDRLTEEVIGGLARIGSLRVISRTTAMSLKQTAKSVPALARELGVRYVLEGSVRRAGNNLRIGVHLVDSSSDSQVWADRFSGTLDDVFDIQERVARAIAEALAVLQEQPADVWQRWTKAMILASAGRRAEAMAVLEPVEPEEGASVAWDYALLLKFALKGERHRFLEVLRPEFVRMAELDACTAVFLAMDYSVAGDTGAALDWLEKAVPRGYFNYPFLRAHDRCTAPLRGHPRFERLLDVMKWKWEAFRA